MGGRNVARRAGASARTMGGSAMGVCVDVAVSGFAGNVSIVVRVIKVSVDERMVSSDIGSEPWRVQPAHRTHGTDKTNVKRMDLKNFIDLRIPSV